MVQIYQPYSLGSELGKALGSGFGEQLNREVGSALIGRELENLKSSLKPGEQFGPDQMFNLVSGLARASSRLGPEQGAQLMQLYPMLANYMANTAKRSDVTTQPGFKERPVSPESDVVSERPLVEFPSQVQGYLQQRGYETPRTLEDAGALAESLREPYVMSPEEQDALRREIVARNPTATPEHIESRIQAEENRLEKLRQAAQVRTENIYRLGETLKNTFDSNLAKRLQSDNLSADIPGTIQQKLYKLAEAELLENLASGKANPKSIGEKWAEIGTEVAKGRKSILTGTVPGLLGRTFAADVDDLYGDYGKTISRFADSAELYKRYGLEEDLRDDLRSAGFTDELASYVSYPPSGKYAMELNKIPKASEGMTAEEALKGDFYAKRDKAKAQAEKALESFNPAKDSLLALKYDLNARGWDDSLFLEILDDMGNLEERFGRKILDREERYFFEPMDPSLKEIFLQGGGSKFNMTQLLRRKMSGGKFQ